MEDFSRYNQNFSHELTSENDRMDVHPNTLFLELQDIYTATYISRTVDSEWDKRVQEKEVPGYSTVRIILYEALVYRVILVKFLEITKSIRLDTYLEVCRYYFPLPVEI